MPILLREEDNAKGVRDYSARFCFVILADLLGLSFYDDKSPSAGQSKFNSVEHLWGACVKRTGGRPIMLRDVLSWDHASEEEKLNAGDEALQDLMERMDGVTFSGTEVHAFQDRCAAAQAATMMIGGQRLGLFCFHDCELKAFMALNPPNSGSFNGFPELNAQQMAFRAEAQESMDSDAVSDLYCRCWRKLCAHGDQQCFFVHRNGMTYCANPLNPDCAERRGPAAFWNLINTFGSKLPTPVPSMKDERQAGSKRLDGSIRGAGAYMDLDERLSTSNLCSDDTNAVDNYHPVPIFEKIDAEENLVKVLAETQTDAPEAKVADLVEKLRADPDAVKQHLKTLVYKYVRRTARKKLKEAQKKDGRAEAVKAFIRIQQKLPPITRQLQKGPKTSPARVRMEHMVEALRLLGVNTAKRNKEVHEAKAPTLVNMVFRKAELSCAADGDTAPILVDVASTAAVVAPSVAVPTPGGEASLADMLNETAVAPADAVTYAEAGPETDSDEDQEGLEKGAGGLAGGKRKRPLDGTDSETKE